MTATGPAAAAGAARRTVLQITPYYPPHLGGLERVVKRLAQRLGRRHDVRVVTTSLGAGSAGRRAREGAVAVRRHRAVELAHTAIAPGLPLSLLRAPRGAVLHLHCAHALLPELVALVARLRRQRFLLHFHLDVDASGRLGVLLPLYKTHVFGRVLRAAAGVVVLTETQATFVRETYRVPAERVFVVPNGVGDEYFLPVRGTAPAAGDAPLRLLFVGRLSPQKNVARLLDALSRVHGDVRLRVVGDGELRAELEATVDRLGLRERVEFSGGLHGADLVRAYAEADAFVLPSDKEGMPLVALEAMAAGLPVLATRVPGNSELLGGVGLLADPEPAALAAAVDALAADPGLRSRLARQSAEAAPAYSWEAVARRVEAVYAEVYPGFPAEASAVSAAASAGVSG
jgi:glycosyltransferase involved in cell wall biosynthesis